MLLVGIGRHHREKRWPMVIDAVSARGRDGCRSGWCCSGRAWRRARCEKRIGDSPHIRLFRPVYDRQRLARIMASARRADPRVGRPSRSGWSRTRRWRRALPLIVPDEGGAFEASAPAYAEDVSRAGRPAPAPAAIERLFARDSDALRAAAARGGATVRSDEDHADGAGRALRGRDRGEADRR